ncbi:MULTISPECIES: response regulator transcription factor [unclassified Motilimonas]|uniref:response regulator n=1 Tax=Motilimonas TaxID=1914248 RepID=UPI001E2BCFD9|nr:MULTISPECIES: response regulator transcription factor [unclassified Motilimonas]MCE0557753.1 response regulator transcription factor [Motilimonas sp. E26]MDO6525936.1 response regulator transcription factor [Motilimonas sp. 1_MG-2023]
MNSAKQILIVDDDTEIRELLQQYLAKAGFAVTTAAEGIEMFQRLNEMVPDLIILDIMMPGDDGFTLCQKIRRDSNVPIIMLTASSDETDRVIGLEIGADDYIAKPFSPRELLARIKALLRRAQFSASSGSRYIHFANWRLDTLKRSLTSQDKEELELSGADYNLLMLFLQHPNQILDRDTISDATRGREALPMERGIDVQLSRLRQRLGDNGKSPKLIKTIRGAGYVLIAEVKHEG